MKKDGFISMAVVYSFIIIFVLLILSLLNAYAFRNRVITREINELKNELNMGVKK